MAGKSNIRSMRFSDDILAMIESQAGETFTAKFENLVTRCMWELPQREEKLKVIKERIDQERKNLHYLQDTKRKLEQNINSLNFALQNVTRHINEVCKVFEKIET